MLISSLHAALASGEHPLTFLDKSCHQYTQLELACSRIAPDDPCITITLHLKSWRLTNRFTNLSLRLTICLSRNRLKKSSVHVGACMYKRISKCKPIVVLSRTMRFYLRSNNNQCVTPAKDIPLDEESVLTTEEKNTPH